MFRPAYSYNTHFFYTTLSLELELSTYKNCFYDSTFEGDVAQSTTMPETPEQTPFMYKVLLHATHNTEPSTLEGVIAQCAANLRQARNYGQTPIP